MKNVLVFMDMSKMDEIVLKQVKQLERVWGFDKICLMHYIELQELTDDFSTQFPDLDKPLEDILEDEIVDTAMKVGWERDDFSIKIHRKGGKDDLTHWVNNSDYNLCVFGKKVINPGSGIFASKIARLIDKSILFTTETSRPNFDNVMLCVDFSSYSKKAVKFLNHFIPDSASNFSLFHVYKVPAIYFPFVKQKSGQLVEEEKKKAEKALDNFREKFTKQPKSNAWVEFADGQPSDKVIYNYARTHHVDLIVVGIKGKSDDDDLLIGSVAEKLIQSDRHVPVLLVQ
ncbi:Nucleotide-binding universal stress protein, UspA family [Marivirga sericea]|uniref:Nucleotide-binding universal stress protein, UspA family n=1 Tax=Marivirga sericea TaxID=1028 RepID=A0A1X7L2M8_9BACT|nr:universal stress protein [Marivirga sericea]SMG47339.1 Nucleotide-binding universal stress protein, UspA family [Marivirga sericea]